MVIYIDVDCDLDLSEQTNDMLHITECETGQAFSGSLNQGSIRQQLTRCIANARQ